MRSIRSGRRIESTDAAIGQRASALLKLYAKSDCLRTFDSLIAASANQTELQAREQEPETLRNDRRFAA
jgi:hypothetical protein